VSVAVCLAGAWASSIRSMVDGGSGATLGLATRDYKGETVMLLYRRA
jgi:hypothetical protein